MLYLDRYDILYSLKRGTEMKKILFKIMGICIVIGLLMPVTVGLKYNSDNMDSNSMDSAIDIIIDKIDDDGHLTFAVRNYCIIDVDNATILIRFRGSCPFMNRNNVDVDTEIFVEHLPIGEKGLYKTKDQVFRVLPIIRRPVVLFFGGSIDVRFNGYIREVPITKMMALIRMGKVIIPYP